MNSESMTSAAGPDDSISACHRATDESNKQQTQELLGR
jgi:hypothetical protein